MTELADRRRLQSLGYDPFLLIPRELPPVRIVRAGAIEDFPANEAISTFRASAYEYDAVLILFKQMTSAVSGLL